MPAEFNTHEPREIAHVHAGANLWNIAEQELRHLGKNPRDAKAVNSEVHHLADINHITDGKLTIHQGQLLKLYETCFDAKGHKPTDTTTADRMTVADRNGNGVEKKTEPATAETQLSKTKPENPNLVFHDGQKDLYNMRYPVLTNRGNQQTSYDERLPDQRQAEIYEKQQEDLIGAKLPDVKSPFQLVAPGGHPFNAAEIAQTKSFAVDQAGHGDCWFESSLAGLARNPNGPATIASMITADKDGYVVTFPGDTKNPVHVNEKEIDADNLADQATWAKVVEAALIKKDPNDAQNGGQIAAAIKLLTGNDSTAVATSAVSQLDLAHQISEALKTGGLVGAQTPNPQPAIAGRTDTASPNSALINHHAYSVISYDSSGPDGGTVTVRNPWGNNNGTAVGAAGTTHDGVTNIGGGELKMSLADFKQKFTSVTVEHTDKSLLANVEDLGWSVAQSSGVLSIFDNIPDAFASV
jgi:hypothetical protein